MEETLYFNSGRVKAESIWPQASPASQVPISKSSLPTRASIGPAHLLNPACIVNTFTENIEPTDSFLFAWVFEWHSVKVTFVRGKFWFTLSPFKWPQEF